MDLFHCQIVGCSIFYVLKHGMQTHVYREHNNVWGTWHFSTLNNNPLVPVPWTITETWEILRVDRITDASVKRCTEVPQNLHDEKFAETSALLSLPVPRALQLNSNPFDDLCSSMTELTQETSIPICNEVTEELLHRWNHLAQFLDKNQAHKMLLQRTEKHFCPHLVSHGFQKTVLKVYDKNISNELYWKNPSEVL